MTLAAEIRNARLRTLAVLGLIGKGAHFDYVTLDDEAHTLTIHALAPLAKSQKQSTAVAGRARPIVGARIAFKTDEWLADLDRAVLNIPRFLR